MADNPPYMNAYGLIPKILKKILHAKTPDRFTQDFLGTQLGLSGGSAKAFIPFAKRIGLLQSDGVPTDVYTSFRNPSVSRTAIASSIRTGYAEFFARNEYAHSLDRKELDGLVVQITGLEQNSKVVRAITSSFEALKEFADFEGNGIPVDEKPPADGPMDEILPLPPAGLGMNLSYTINLVLPKTDDVAVFNAIFRSLRDNLLQKQTPPIRPRKNEPVPLEFLLRISIPST